LNFTDDIIGQAENSVARIENAYANVEHRLQALQPDESKTLESVNAELAAKLVQIREMFHAKMQDDFNTADAITAWFDAVSEANQLLKRDEATYVELKAIADVFGDFNQVLGLVVTETNDLLDEEIENLIAERVEARQTKNWKRADEIRDLLAEKNIILEDTPQGMRWRRK
jgi:cysteinyl-tRNA synthetase